MLPAQICLTLNGSWLRRQVLSILPVPGLNSGSSDPDRGHKLVDSEEFCTYSLLLRCRQSTLCQRFVKVWLCTEHALLQ